MTQNPHLKHLGTPLLLAALFALTALAYSGVGRNTFHFDDWHNILLNASVHMEQFSVEALAEAAAGASLGHRPIPSMTFAIDWWRGGDNPAYFLHTNLLFHLLSAAAVFMLLRAALRIALNEGGGFRTELAAALAAAWWAVQPIHVQAVGYVVQRMTGLAALCTVLGVWAYLKGRLAAQRGWAWYALCASFLLIGALSKPNAWISPVLLLATEYLLLRNATPLITHPRDRLILAVPVLAAMVGGLLLAIEGPVKEWALASYSWRDFTMTERLLTQPKVLAFHASQLLWPHPARFSLDHDVEIVRGLASWQFFLPFAAIVAWVGIGVRLALRKGARITGYFMLWPPITLVIESTVIPLEMMFEHRMYLPTVGVAGLIALGLVHAHRRSATLYNAVTATLVAAVALSAWATHERLPQWRTVISLLENSAIHAPNSVRVWNQLGVEYLKVGRLEEAARANARANQIEPRWGDGYPFVNRGVILEAMGQPEQARAIYAETIRRFPKQVLGYNNLGLLHLREGDIRGAIDYFDQALTVDADYSEAWTNRGTARFFLGDREGARRDFEQALRLSPRESLAYHYLARLYAESGRHTDAARARAKACALGVSQNCAAANRAP